VTASILSFARRKSADAPLAPQMPWQNQDLAELYRVRDRLAAAGLNVEVDNGVSDEGDPWFIYQQAGTDNIVVHIARIDTQLHVINCVTGNVYVGTSFRDVSDRMLEDASLSVGSQIRRSSNVVIHPSAFLTAFVAAAIMLVDLLEHNRAEAAESQPGDGYAGQGDQHHHAAFPLADGTPPAHAVEGSAESTPDEDGVAQAGVPSARRPQKDGATSLMNSPATGQLASYGHAGSLIDGSGLALGLSAHLFAAEFLDNLSQHAAASEVTDHALAEPADLSMFDEGVWHAAYASTFTMSGHANPVALQAAGVPTSAADVEIDMPNLEALVTPSVAKVPDHPDSVEAATTAAETAPAQPDAIVLSESSVVMTSSSCTDAVAFMVDTGPKAVSPASAATASASAVQATNASGAQVGSSGSAAAESTASATPTTVRPILDSREFDWIVAHVISDPDSASKPETTTGPDAEDLPPNEGSGPEPVTGGPDIVDSLVAARTDIVYAVAGTSMIVEGFVLGEDLLVFAEDHIDSATSHAWQDGADLVMGDSDVGTVRLVGVLADTSSILYPPGTPAAA